MFSDITQLNESHQRLRQLARQLRVCRDHEVGTTYARLLAWIEKMFGTEQQLMEKHEFPAARCHLEQHARVLCAMHQVHCAVMRGDHALGRHTGATLLCDWFDVHNATLDAAVTLWTCYRISHVSHDSDHAHSWVEPEMNARPPRTSPLLWHGPERRSRPRQPMQPRH